MKNTIVTENPIVLEGYQAILKPSKFGYSLSAIVDEEMVKTLEQDREQSLEWAKSKLKNPRRSTLKPEPWIESEETPNMYRIKFTWNAETKPPIVDTEGTPITNENTPLYSGSQASGFKQSEPNVVVKEEEKKKIDEFDF